MMLRNIFFVFFVFWGCQKTTLHKSARSIGTKDESETIESKKPNLYVISVGTSEYTGEVPDLSYADKDAREFARMMSIIACPEMFISKNISVLSTSNDDTNPSKENIKQAFEKLKSISPSDVLVVYMAGHGVKQTETKDDYLYLTRYTSSLAQLEDVSIRSSNAISSEELHDWIRDIPANKKVLILDTCAAGSAANDLSKRNISSEHLASLQRAIKKLQQSSGFYILMGSTANAESYESSRYGQSLLMYALLEGVQNGKGVSNHVVQIDQLFAYAQERVHVLAKGIGGIQEPMVAVPDDQNFPLGWVDESLQKQIAIKQIKPQVIRPEFFDTAQIIDVLNLNSHVSEALRKATYDDVLLYLDVDTAPHSCKISGEYSVSEDIELTLFLEHSEMKNILVQDTLKSARNDTKGLSEQIVHVILKHCPLD